MLKKCYSRAVKHQLSNNLSATSGQVNSKNKCKNIEVTQVCINKYKLNAQNQSVIIAQSIEHVLVDNNLSLMTNVSQEKFVTQEQMRISNNNKSIAKSGQENLTKECNNIKVIQVCNNLDKLNAQNQSIIIAQSIENILVNNDLSLTTNIV